MLRRRVSTFLFCCVLLRAFLPGAVAGAVSPLCTAALAPKPSSRYVVDFNIKTESNAAYDVLVDPERSPLKAGDVLVLPGQEVIFHGWLGAGNTTRIIDIGGRALRVPKRSGWFYQESESTLFIEAFLKGYRALEGSAIPRVRVFEDESGPPFYLVVEKLKVYFDLEQYFAGSADLEGLEISSEQMDAEIAKFLATTWSFSWIPDFSPKQICWTDRGLVLMDFYADEVQFRTTRATHVDSRSFVEIWMNRKSSKVWRDLPEDYRKRFADALYTERRKRGLVLTTEDPVEIERKKAADAAMQAEFGIRQ